MYAPAFDALDEQQRRELWAALALRHTKGLGTRRIARLLKRFGSAYAALEATVVSTGWRPVASEAMVRDVASGTWRESARQEWERLRGASCGILLWTDSAYPKQLKELPDAPALLFCLGDISLLRGPGVAIVGSRLCTRHGQNAAGRLAYDLSRHGITVISGMAKGIDRIAHLAALQACGSSIAVLGCGIDICYPAASSDAWQNLLHNGLIISEYGPGVPPQSALFPVRNRLISGLSLAVVVIEAANRSGSLITARLALEQGRDVYAVPGPALDPASYGCQDLVRQGARPVFAASDILENLSVELGRYVLPQSPQPEKDWQTSVFAAPAAGHDKPETEPDSAHMADEPGAAFLAASPSLAPGKKEKAGQKQLDTPTGAKKAADAKQLQLPDLSETEKSIVEFLKKNPDAHLDEICRECSLEVAETSRSLVCMELYGVVYQVPGMRYKVHEV